MTLQIGVCLSLTGRYERFGRQAAEGLNAWQGLVGDGVSFRVEDDRSDRDRLPVVLKQVT
jgi:hypothetical protein